MIPLQQSIVTLLAYFDIFSYPLKKEELAGFLQEDAGEEGLETALADLQKKDLIFYHGGFYGLQDSIATAARRKKANALAALQLPTAYQTGRFISRFPFVKAVAISGSLSKNAASENSDFDYFIITRTNRLWLTRTLLHLFKKFTYLSGRQHRYCMNYFVDETALQLREKNVFTAIELATVKPVAGRDTFNAFYAANKWAHEILPVTNSLSATTAIPELKKNFTARLTEKILGNKTGDWLDNLLMRFTINRWQKKTERGLKGMNGILMCMDAGKHYSKPHPGQLQEKILTRFQLKQEQALRQLSAAQEKTAVLT